MLTYQICRDALVWWGCSNYYLILRTVLLTLRYGKQDDMSNFNFNEADIKYMSDAFGDSILKRISLATRLAGLSAEEVVSYFKAEEVVPHFRVENIWASLSPEEKQKLMELALADEE